jgi:hypothetical protein
MNDTPFLASPPLNLSFAGGAHTVELRMPTIGEIFPLLLARPLRSRDRMRVLGPAEIKRFIAKLDRRDCDIESARALQAEPAAFAQYAITRTRWLEAACEAGMMLAQCPHCRSWDADLAPLAYAIGLRHEFRPIADDDFYLTMPTLADPAPLGVRPPEVAKSSRLRFVLPCQSQFSGGTFRIGDCSAAEVEAWRRWAPADGPRAEGHEQWREDIAGFRAVLRLAVALETLGENAKPPGPADVMTLPLADFLFLDNLHFLLHDLAIPSDHGLLVQCGKCGRRFLPVL